MALIASGAISSRIDSYVKGQRESRDDLQDVLVSIAYQAARGNPNWANELLAKVRDTKSVYLKPLTIWLEKFAPLVLKNGEFVVNKGMAKTMHVDSEEAFTPYEIECRKVMWYDMTPKQKAESIFEAPKYVSEAFDRMAKKLNDEGQPDLSNAVKKMLAQLYTTDAYKAAVAAANA